MALAEVQSIMATLKDAAQRQLQQKQLDLQQSQQESEAANRLAQRDEAEARLAEEVKQHDIINKAAKAQLDMQLHAHTLANSQALQQMGQVYQQSGVAPGGAQFSPAASGPTGDFSPANPQTATSQMMSIPGVDGQVQVVSPEQAAQQQAARAEILAAPARQTETLKQQAETDRLLKTQKAQQEEETKRQLLIAQQSQAAEKERLQMTIAGENSRNALSTATQLKIALIPSQMFNNMNPQTRTAMTQPSIDALTNGTMSAKQVQQEFAEKGMAGGGAAVIGSFMAAGGVPPTDKQVQFLQQIKPIIDNLTPIAQYIQALPTTTGSMQSHIAGLKNADLLNPDLAAKYKQIEFQIATVAKTLGGDAGQRLQRALLAPAEGGYLPDKYQPTTANVSNYNKLLQVVHQAIDSSLGSLPPAQRATIKNNIGLTGVPNLQPNGQPAAGVSQPTQTQGPIHKYYDAQGNQIVAPGNQQ